MIFWPVPAVPARTRGRQQLYVSPVIEVGTRDNGRSACSYGARPLGVACPCGHRALVPLATIGVHDGDMRRLHDLVFSCSTCGRRGGQQLWLMTSDRDEAAFLHPTLGPAP